MKNKFKMVFKAGHIILRLNSDESSHFLLNDNYTNFW